MTLTLSKNLERYFAAQNAHDAEAMVTCFALDAEVRDEGHEYAGREEILQWKKDTIAKYGISIEPLSLTDEGDTTRVVARVAGNFPGSPAELSYDFRLGDDGLIEALRIHSL
ncbi:MAG TPA: nuclear transport factor 2 family protein [Sphingomicrobium sp.]|nr:nuclear transport factor 2 family protein [Sphingomicrobium sp.]